VLARHQRAVRRLEELARLTTSLSGARSEREVLARLATGVKRLFDSVRRVEVFRLDGGSHELIPTSDPAGGRALLAALCAGIDAIADALAGAALIPYLVVSNLVPSDRARGRGSMLSAPLLFGTTLLGLLVVEAEPAAPDFQVADADLLASVAAQVSVVVQQLRAKGGVEERQRFREQDLTLARRIQRQFLPQLSPEVGGFRVASAYQPAFDVGGDFYDVVPAGAGRVTAVIGDVSGKGMAAALIMSRVSSDFRRLARTRLSPPALLGELNTAVAEQAPEDTFVTVACVHLDAARRRGVVANAGHVLPIVRQATGRVRALGGGSGPPLGMVPGQTYAGAEFDLLPGDVVILMTDGVAESLDPGRNPLELGRLLELVAAAPHDGAEINRRILAEVDRSAGPARTDDVTLLALQLCDQAPAR